MRFVTSYMDRIKPSDDDLKGNQPLPTSQREHLTSAPKLLNDVIFQELVFGRDLGSGSFSTVYMAKQKEDQKLYAVKVVKKARLSKEDKVGLQQEISILRSLDNPLVMKLYHVYDSINYYQLVTELVEGGELFQRIVVKTLIKQIDIHQLWIVLLNPQQCTQEIPGCKFE